MNKSKKLLMFLGYSLILSVVTALLVILFFRIFPERTGMVYFIVPLFGIIFGLLCYLPYRHLLEEQKK